VSTGKCIDVKASSQRAVTAGFMYCFNASAGPNEEWCVDGHEKIKNLMGIIDKCSRVELGLWAMPDARVPEMPPAQLLHYIYVW